MWPGSGVLGTRRTRIGLQFAPGSQNVAWECCSGNGFIRFPEDSQGFLRIPGAAGSGRICPDPAQTPLGRQDAFF
eukprot:5554321-Pyramimonas_sp.AAC.1